MVVVGDGPKRLRLRDPGCFLIRSLMVRYELVSVFGLVVIFWMNACIKRLSGMLFNYDRAVLLLLYVKDRPDAFFWPWTPSASIMPESNCSVKWFASFPACCLMAQGAPLQYRWWYFWIIMSCITLLNNVNFNSWSFSSWYKPFEGNCWKRSYCLDHLKES